MVHRVYICSNHKSYFIVQKYDQLEDCNSYNLVMSSSSSFVLKKHDKSQEGEHSWLLPTTCPSTKVKPRMVCYEEGDDDEDMTPTDTTMKVVGTKFRPVPRAHEQAERVCSMELEIRLASAQGWSILCTPPETCQSI